ncbi:hypothetical protein Tco_0510410 [Tanacetum coccineum]
MAALPICDELRRSVDTVDWESEAFADELDMLAGKYVPGKMAEFTKRVQSKDIPNLMKLQILRREFELRAQEKEIFIKKLKDVSFVVPPTSFILIDCATVVGLVGGVVVFQEDQHTVYYDLIFSFCFLDLFSTGCTDAAGVVADVLIPLLQELLRAADSYDIRDQLSVLFRREVVKDSQRMNDYRRLSDELTEGIKMRDEYMNELQMLVNYDEILDSIEIMRRMQLDNMEKSFSFDGDG